MYTYVKYRYHIHIMYIVCVYSIHAVTHPLGLQIPIFAAHFRPLKLRWNRWQADM